MSEDPITEMRFALAEGEASNIGVDSRSRILATVLGSRPAGQPVNAAERIGGTETFRRMTARMDSLLGSLSPADWRAPTIRGLDVQQLVGHLIGVEAAFTKAVEGSPEPADVDHVESTQAAATAEAGQDPTRTRAKWAAAVAATKTVISEGPKLTTPVRMHGITFELDAFLVVRAFELWTHDEDIRRAIGRPLADPDPAVLGRMTDLATALLPLGVALAGGRGSDRVRLVLTGPGGGTWDVGLSDGASRAEPGRTFDTHVTVDAAAFCRVVANRSSLEESASAVRGPAEPARVLFAGAAALALD